MKSANYDVLQIVMKIISFQVSGLGILLLEIRQVQMQLQMHSCTCAGPTAASCQLHDTFDKS